MNLSSSSSEISKSFTRRFCWNSTGYSSKVPVEILSKITSGILPKVSPVCSENLVKVAPVLSITKYSTGSFLRRFISILLHNFYGTFFKKILQEFLEIKLWEIYENCFGSFFDKFSGIFSGNFRWKLCKSLPGNLRGVPPCVPLVISMEHLREFLLQYCKVTDFFFVLR